MVRISSGIFNRWLASYGLAWEEGDPQGVAALFTDQATYYVTPFDKPISGSDAIQEYWRSSTHSKQQDISFSYRIISVWRNKGIAHWQASFLRPDSKELVELDGILLAEFDETGLCTEFKEWWHRKGSRDDDQAG